jgi:hypothetical protein
MKPSPFPLNNVRWLQDIKGVFQYRNISYTKMEDLAGLLAFFKQQVMIGAQCHSSVSSTSVSVKTPTRLFPLFDCFADVVVVSY